MTPDAPYNPLALIATTVIALLAFAVVLVSFLVAPLAILLIFAVALASSDRSRRGGRGRPAVEPATARAQPRR